MRTGRLNTILALPTLGPFDVLPRARGGRCAFPLDRPQLETTYLGRNAVWRMVRRLGLAGAEVVVPAYHHGVELSALLDAGVRPAFARVDEAMRLDLDDVEAHLGPKTRAVYVIHYAGFPQPLEELRALCRRRGLLLIEDCALATFSRDGDVPLGSVGDAAIFCFYKTVPVPHGGALLLSRDVPEDPRARELPLESPPLFATVSHTFGSVFLTGERQLGPAGALVRRVVRGVSDAFVQRAWEEDVPVGTQQFDRNVVTLGMSRITEWVLRHMDAEEIVRRRRENWRWLHARLDDSRRAVWRDLPSGVCPLFYALRVRDKDRALQQLQARGVEAVDFWRWSHPAVEKGRFPEVERLRAEVVELPCHQDLGEEELQRIAAAAHEVMT